MNSGLHAPTAAGESRSQKSSGRRVPLGVKLVYTAFVCVLVPYYWSAYGPTNFLYFCDVALLMTLAAMWTESPLLASMPAVGILLPQTFWCIDFLGSFIGLPVTGMTAYMFDPSLTLFTRGLSFFHFWLPFLLLWLVWQLGYDRRAMKLWTVLAWGLMLTSYFLLPAPAAPRENPNVPVNVNYVYGFDESAPQTWVPPLAFLAIMMTALPLIVFAPTHVFLAKVFGREHEMLNALPIEDDVAFNA
ncbi:MAG: hypothetical protein WD065_17985 [Planctomycetaceae bacterium]